MKWILLAQTVPRIALGLQARSSLYEMKKLGLGLH